MTVGIETASSAGKKKVFNLDLLIGNMPKTLISDSAKVLVCIVAHYDWLKNILPLS